MRAETFQSMLRTSSPTWYSRTSEELHPAPAKTLLVLPRHRLLDEAPGPDLDPPDGAEHLRRDSADGHLGNLDGVEDPPDDLLRGDLLGLGLIGQDERCRRTSWPIAFTSSGVT